MSKLGTRPARFSLAKTIEAQRKRENPPTAKPDDTPPMVFGRPITNEFGLAVTEMLKGLPYSKAYICRQSKLRTANLRMYTADGTVVSITSAINLQKVLNGLGRNEHNLVKLAMIKNRKILLTHLPSLLEDLIIELVRCEPSEAKIAEIFNILASDT